MNVLRTDQRHLSVLAWGTNLKQFRLPLQFLIPIPYSSCQRRLLLRKFPNAFAIQRRLYLQLLQLFLDFLQPGLDQAPTALSLA